MAGYPTILHTEEILRDGMQCADEKIPVGDKIRLLDALSETGLKEIAVGSFVSPKWTPQMACIEELVAGFKPKPGVRYTYSALNEKGLQRAKHYVPPLSPRIREYSTKYSLCEVFALRNSNKTQAQEIANWPKQIAKAKADGIEYGGISISCAWGSNWTGEFSQEQRMLAIDRMVSMWAEAGITVQRINLADPMSWALPHKLEQQLAAIKERWPSITDFNLHLHNGRGLALASVCAALRVLDSGDTLRLQSSIGGLAGCPYCGNGQAAMMIATEDLMHLLEEMGISTGVDMDKLISAVWLAEEIVGHRLFGFVSKAGPIPRYERLYPMDMPRIETIGQAKHFLLGAKAYEGMPSPWREPIRSYQRPESPLGTPGNTDNKAETFAGVKAIQKAAGQRPEDPKQALPLKGLRVLELSHIVAGPSAGLILGDLGAEVIKIEHPATGDTARSNSSNGATFFTYNRNKRYLALNLKEPKGAQVFERLVARSDVVLDNFAPNALNRLGLGYKWGSKINPRIIYCSVKGFLPGPYSDRPFLDELAQMAGGLAYLTGMKDQPMRAGASITDIGAASYGVLGILAALYRRQSTGKGDYVEAGLYETIVFWISQYITRAQLTGTNPPARGSRNSGMGKAMGWGVYQLFPTSNGRQIFIAVTANRHWSALCDVLGFDDWRSAPEFSSNRRRSEEKKRIAERITTAVAKLPYDELALRLYKAQVPFAPVNTPMDLLEETHLREGNRWMPIRIPGQDLKVPKIPLAMSETVDYQVREQPAPLGEHSDVILSELGYSGAEIQALKAEKIVLKGDRMLDVDGSGD